MQNQAIATYVVLEKYNTLGNFLNANLEVRRSMMKKEFPTICRLTSMIKTVDEANTEKVKLRKQPSVIQAMQFVDKFQGREFQNADLTLKNFITVIDGVNGMSAYLYGEYELQNREYKGIRSNNPSYNRETLIQLIKTTDDIIEQMNHIFQNSEKVSVDHIVGELIKFDKKQLEILGVTHVTQKSSACSIL